MATTSKEFATGDCFKRSYHYLVDGKWNDQEAFHFFREPKLCHGIVWHKLRGHHIHGWVEDDILAYDFVRGKLICVPKFMYYENGKIQDKKGWLFRYTKRQAMKGVLDKGMYYFSDLVENV